MVSENHGKSVSDTELFLTLELLKVDFVISKAELFVQSCPCPVPVTNHAGSTEGNQHKRDSNQIYIQWYIYVNMCK